MIIKRHKAFVNAFKKARIADTQFSKFVTYIALLKDNKVLPAEARDHELKGNFSGYREFHLGGDLLVIYLTRGDTITLINIGTHAQLFH